MQLLLDTIQSRNRKISQHLLESDHDGRTVLHKAVQGGNMEVIGKKFYSYCNININLFILT